ncbi:hypothetical protein BVC80_9057g41 [Macleaya cordata]|uniref:Uncharacterized protein n=1 Tax=Macleaya cordata TaxID=56857 RepID=A0A200R9S7_MACCD|nr:hypothetical protein BVC80_9057g41 [Macleaya cordata]
MQKLHEEHATDILERRAANNADEMMEIEAAVNEAMSVFNRGGASAVMVAAATSAAREQTNLPVQLDEFGKDVNEHKRIDVMQRAEARK